MEQKIGSQKNPYKLIKQIGQGKFGQIFQGMNEKTKEKVAIKREYKDIPIHLSLIHI